MSVYDEVVVALFGADNSSDASSGESFAGSGDVACAEEGTRLMISVETMFIWAFSFAGGVVLLATVHIWLRCLRDCGRRRRACVHVLRRIATAHITGGTAMRPSCMLLLHREHAHGQLACPLPAM